MACLYAFTICAMIFVGVDAHLHRNRMQHHPFVPIGTPFVRQHNMIDPFLTRPGLFGDGILTQGVLPNVGQMPQTFNNQRAWNNGIPTAQFERNGINNDVFPSKDPWEQYRKFNSGMQSLSGGRLSTTANTVSKPNQFIPGTINNYPWNTFATQNSFSTNIPTLPYNQGLVNPQLQSNQFQNQRFLSQGFPNNQFQNQGFLTQGFPNNNQFQDRGSLTQGFRNGLPPSNGAFI